MEITVNQKLYQVAADCNVKHLLTTVLNNSAQGSAIAINLTIIPKTQWGNHILKSGDKVIIIKATQGG